MGQKSSKCRYGFCDGGGTLYYKKSVPELGGVLYEYAAACPCQYDAFIRKCKQYLDTTSDSDDENTRAKRKRVSGIYEKNLRRQEYAMNFARDWVFSDGSCGDKAVSVEKNPVSRLDFEGEELPF
jgi:hypothetical protein